MEKMNMDKRIDQLKKLQDQQRGMKMTSEIAKYLELNNGITTLKSAIRKDIINQHITKSNGFGVRSTLKQWKDDYILGYRMSSDKKTISGILRGVKCSVHFNLKWKDSYTVRETATLRIEEYINV